jgi:hypothetical protein
VKSAGRFAAAKEDPPLSANWFRQRIWLLALLFGALVYALLAGLRNVSDFDLFWQLPTGRWVAQHHAAFSTDVFSYTASGQPWIYPVGAGLISWRGAIACAGSIILLVRRASPITAVLAIVAVPAIAICTTPRADMFTKHIGFLGILSGNICFSNSRPECCLLSDGIMGCLARYRIRR